MFRSAMNHWIKLGDSFGKGTISWLLRAIPVRIVYVHLLTKNNSLQDFDVFDVFTLLIEFQSFHCLYIEKFRAIIAYQHLRYSFN